MLVLSRRDEEVFFIGPHIKITIVRTSRGLVKIGIDAPREYDISRDYPPQTDRRPPTTPTTETQTE